MYLVYQIKIDGVVRYVGYTNNLKRRQTQHNYLLKIGKKKALYDNIRMNKENFSIKCEAIRQFNNKVEAKRFECLMILMDHFNNKNYYQKVPNISDL